MSHKEFTDIQRTEVSAQHKQPRSVLMSHCSVRHGFFCIFIASVDCLVRIDCECALAGAVAEMTGRRGRVIGDAKGRGIFELRAKPDSTEMDSLNVSETGIH